MRNFTISKHCDALPPCPGMARAAGRTALRFKDACTHRSPWELAQIRAARVFVPVVDLNGTPAKRPLVAWIRAGNLTQISAAVAEGLKLPGVEIKHISQMLDLRATAQPRSNQNAEQGRHICPWRGLRDPQSPTLTNLNIFLKTEAPRPACSPPDYMGEYDTELDFAGAAR